MSDSVTAENLDTAIRAIADKYDADVFAYVGFLNARGRFSGGYICCKQSKKVSGLQGTGSGIGPRSTDSVSYSRAFEAFVASEQDVVGLLAYSLYKQNVREAITKGQPTQPRIHRFPTNVERDVYRGAAERLLQRFSEASVAAATPEILQNGFDGAVESAKDELIETIRERTSTKSAVVARAL